MNSYVQYIAMLMYSTKSQTHFKLLQHTDVILHTDTLKHTYAPGVSEAHKRANGWKEEGSVTPI